MKWNTQPVGKNNTNHILGVTCECYVDEWARVRKKRITSLHNNILKMISFLETKVNKRSITDFSNGLFIIYVDL